MFSHTYFAVLRSSSGSKHCYFHQDFSWPNIHSCIFLRLYRFAASVNPLMQQRRGKAWNELSRGCISIKAVFQKVLMLAQQWWLAVTYVKT